MVGNNAEPGTGTQWYTEASDDPEALAERREECNVDEMSDRELAALRQYNAAGRTWTCGNQYFDTDIGELFTLVAVVRKSAWCSTKPAEEGQLKLQFVGDRFGELIYDTNTQQEDPTERFIERYQAPAPLGAPEY